MMYVALSYDHRIDGRNLLVFSCYQKALESPMELLLDNDPKSI
jgi:pyruvate/2-oxoglutarate dehydrogenase complex dihydrolipoamide acyltransferase (E2) component